MSKTYGENLVRSGFNPSELESVKQLKELAAKVIDLTRQVAEEKINGPSMLSTEAAGEIKRHSSLAVTHFETAAMFAVKVATA